MRDSEKIYLYFKQRDRGFVISLLVAVCLIYLPFLESPFFFDDWNFFKGDSPDYFGTSSFSTSLRWLPYASLGRTWLWVGDIPHLYRLENALIHATSAILLFYMLRHLMAAVLPNLQASTVARAAWFGALVFACHPVAVYAVGYVIQRSILMATMFALVMQFAYLRGLLSGQNRWLVLAVLAYLLAGFSREHSILLPVILLAMTILLRDKNKLETRAQWYAWAAFTFVGVLIILSSNGVLGRPYEVMSGAIFSQMKINASDNMLHVLSAMTQAGLFFKYLVLWLLPNPAWMSIDMREPFVHSLAQWQSWLGVLGFIAYGTLAIWLLLRKHWFGLLGFAMLYSWLLYLVEFSTIRVQEPFVLYRSYLWMPGLAVLVSILLIKLPGRRTMLGFTCIVVLLIAFSWNRLWVFADSYRLWNDAAVLLPNEQVAGADRVLYNRGNASLSAEKWSEAIEDLEKVVELSPEIAPVHTALGQAYFGARRYEESIIQFDASLNLQQNNPEAYLGKGFSYKRLHKNKLAMLQLIKACELKNNMACMIVSHLKDK